MRIRQLPLYKNKNIYTAVFTALVLFLVVWGFVHFVPSSSAMGISWASSTDPSVSYYESSNYQQQISPNGDVRISVKLR